MREGGDGWIGGLTDRRIGGLEGMGLWGVRLLPFGIERA